MSELIRLLSKDTGGSRHYTGWGKNTIANHSRKMLGLQTQTGGCAERQKGQERENKIREEEKVEESRMRAGRRRQRKSQRK